jgi:DNA-binding transcriptional LysR family regulator
MNSEQLNSFISVADCGSFSASEKKEYLSKQAIIKQINQLESEVGVPLFARSVRGIFLTEEGKLFYEGVQKLLAEEQELLKACRTHSSQPRVLRLSNVDHQKLLTPVTREFVRRYPDIEVEYVIHPNHCGEYRVLHNIMDIAETFHDPDKEDLGNLLSGGTAYIPLAEFPYVAVMAPEHTLAANNRLEIEELVSYETYYFEAITRQMLADRLLECFTPAPEHLHCLSDIDQQISLTYSIIERNEILITCNPYAYYIKDARIVPLNVPETLEYGILLSDKPSCAAVLYRDLALQMFRTPGNRKI